LSDPWFTILRWTLLLAIVGAVVGTPVVYFNHRIDAAHTLGLEEGRAACVADYAAQSLKAANARQAQAQEEAEKAAVLQQQLDKSEKGSNDLRKRLAEELQKNPPPATCILSSSATDSLRELANGAYPTPSGEPVPSPLYPKVPRDSPAPGENPTRHGG
jgi:hypothetical protein